MSIDAESSPRSGSALQRLEPPTAVSPTVRPLLTNITRTYDNVTAIKSFNNTRRLQGAQMVGGAPPEEVEMAMCDIATVFAKLTEIKANPDCTAGCAGGTGECPASWYPGRVDMCSAECGRVFEPFCAPTRAHPLQFRQRSDAVESRVWFNPQLSERCKLCAGDQCGQMLVASGMGGMDEMSIFCENQTSSTSLLGCHSDAPA